MNKKEITCYETDASRLIGKAEKVVFPKTIKEIKDFIKTADLDIVPRGAGTSLVGGCIPNNSLIIDVSKMNKVLNLDKANHSIYVEAGVTLKELNEKLNSFNFEFPINPLNHGISSLGGMIATNASDNKSMRYGDMSDWIKEIDFINGRGDLIKISKSDVKDVCGMEGINGIIAGAKLKIIPKINRTLSVFQSDKLEEVLSITRRLKLEKEVISLELFSKELSKILNLPEKYHLLVGFDSDRGKIKNGDILKIRDNLFFMLYKNEYYNIENGKFFFDNLEEFINYLEQNRIFYFANLGSGVVYPIFKDDEEEKRQEILEFLKKKNIKTNLFGIGLVKKEFTEGFDMKVIQRVKLRYDPFNKFNKNKLIRVEGGIFETYKIKKKKESPEKKMESLIKNAEEIEKESLEIKQIIKDYEDTFDSELSKDKMKIIEDIAKDIPKKISEEMFKNTEIPKKENNEIKDTNDFNIDNLDNKIEKRGKLSEDEEKLVRGVMGNMFGKGDKDDNRK